MGVPCTCIPLSLTMNFYVRDAEPKRLPKLPENVSFAVSFYYTYTYFIFTPTPNPKFLFHFPSKQGDPTALSLPTVLDACSHIYS